VLVCDPAWPFRDQLPGPRRGVRKIYKTTAASIEAICAEKLPRLHEDCHLFLWRVGAMAEEAFAVGRAWGFEYTGAELVWVKRTKNGNRHFGMGRTARNEHETCLVFRRGRPVLRSLSVRSTFDTFDAPVGEHSGKPDAFYDLVEDLCFGPYAEMHARRRRLLPDGTPDPAWTHYGDELPPPPRRAR